MVILVADDDPLVAMMLEAHFTTEGHKVITTNNGREALRKIEEISPDIIITDVMMPFYSGLEIVARIKDKFKNDVIVIVLSAMAQESAVKEAFDLGADDYVIKPFSLGELSLRLKWLINKSVRNNKLQLNDNI